jgi:hypothetical protein
MMTRPDAEEPLVFIEMLLKFIYDSRHAFHPPNHERAAQLRAASSRALRHRKLVTIQRAARSR